MPEDQTASQPTNEAPSGLRAVTGSVIQEAKTGECMELPPPGAPSLNPPVKRGDKIRTLCRIIGDGNPGWLCGPYTVIYFSGDKPVYRPRYAKVDKVANEWVLFSQNSKASEPGLAPSTSPSLPPTTEPRPGSL